MFYLLTPILGLIAGIIIAFFVKEELKPGLRYFRISQSVLLLLISAFLIIYDFNLLYFVLGFVLGIYLRQPYLYFGLALPLILSSFLIVPLTLMFIFGLDYGTLKSYYLKLNKHKLFDSLLLVSALFIIAIVISDLIPYYKIISLSSGALIAIVLKPQYFYSLLKKK